MEGPRPSRASDARKRMGASSVLRVMCVFTACSVAASKVRLGEPPEPCATATEVIDKEAATSSVAATAREPSALRHARSPKANSTCAPRGELLLDLGLWDWELEIIGCIEFT